VIKNDAVNQKRQQENHEQNPERFLQDGWSLIWSARGDGYIRCVPFRWARVWLIFWQILFFVVQRLHVNSFCCPRITRDYKKEPDAKTFNRSQGVSISLKVYQK